MTKSMKMEEKLKRFPFYRCIFRGKSGFGNDEWIVGYTISYSADYDKMYINHCWIDHKIFGQCTSVSDKNVELIFEGDILKYKGGDLGVVFWDEAMLTWRIKDDVGWI